MVYNRLYSPSWQQHKQKEQQETRLVTKLAKTKPFPVEIYRSINLCDPWNASPPTADKDSVNQLYLVPPPTVATVCRFSPISVGSLTNFLVNPSSCIQWEGKERLGREWEKQGWSNSGRRERGAGGEGMERLSTTIEVHFNFFSSGCVYTCPTPLRAPVPPYLILTQTPTQP